MIELGNYNTLKVLRSTSIGLFLGDDEGTEILLPNKYVPEDFEIDQDLEVFCYLDNAERPISTTLKPKIVRNGFAYLEVVEVGNYGAFLDWGLEKHLLVPFREQSERMEGGANTLFIVIWMMKACVSLGLAGWISSFPTKTWNTNRMIKLTFWFIGRPR